MLPEAGPTSRVYFSQRLRLHYVDWGNPGAPPLILLHGGRDHCRNWDWVAADLRRDYHVIAPDLRGHGDSANGPQDGTLHDGRLHLRPGPAHPSAARGPRHHRRPLARRQHRAALRRASTPRTSAKHGRHRGARTRHPRKHVSRRAPRQGHSPSACAPGSTRSAGKLRPPAAPLCFTVEDAFAAHAGGEQAPHPRAGAPSDAARREPERGRHLQLEVRQLRALSGRPTT